MRCTWLVRLSGLAVCVLSSMVVFAGGHPIADYSLRVHLFVVSQHSHYRQGTLDYVDGEGRANLFENGYPRGLDYGFRCRERLMVSAGYETYPARWKKPGKVLEILLPVMGKPGAAAACDLKVQMKEDAYYRQNGALEEEPAARFKEWMNKHQYDPEHGRNEPVSLAPSTGNREPAANATQQ